jgi:hypothetical protein
MKNPSNVLKFDYRLDSSTSAVIIYFKLTVTGLTGHLGHHVTSHAVMENTHEPERVLTQHLHTKVLIVMEPTQTLNIVLGHYVQVKNITHTLFVYYQA